MRPRPTFSKSLGLVVSRLRHLSATLPFVSFQSLTNFPRFVTHSEPLSFQPITNSPVCKPFVLITIQYNSAGGGWVSSAATFQPSNLQTSQAFTFHTLFQLFVFNHLHPSNFVTPLFLNSYKMPGVYVPPFLPSRAIEPSRTLRKEGRDRPLIALAYISGIGEGIQFGVKWSYMSAQARPGEVT
jgi:hypothetical protein